MKKLSKRTNTYTPTNASLVRGNCDRILNKEETLSVSNSKTLDNRSEVNQSVLKFRAGTCESPVPKFHSIKIRTRFQLS